TFSLQTVLRGELGIDGVMFSDDLEMTGAAAAGTMQQRADAALAAGCDMSLVWNDRAAALQALAHLQQRGQGGNKRLLRMFARERWTPEQLQASEQWQQARMTIDSLLREAEQEGSNEFHA